MAWRDGAVYAIQRGKSIAVHLTVRGGEDVGPQWITGHPNQPGGVVSTDGHAIHFGEAPGPRAVWTYWVRVNNTGNDVVAFQLRGGGLT